MHVHGYTSGSDEQHMELSADVSCMIRSWCLVYANTASELLYGVATVEVLDVFAYVCLG
jgi:hypothetical protein